MTVTTQYDYLHNKKLWHMSTRICINECSFQTDMHDEDSSEETGHHNKETNHEIKLHEQLSKACIHQNGMLKM